MEQLKINVMLEEISNVMTEHREYLIDIDNLLGDGDLGLTMSDGFLAAYESLDDEVDLGKKFFKAGKSMMNKVPSTMGTLMGRGLMEAGKALRGEEQLTEENIAIFLEAYFRGVQQLGKAEVGEKTFLDGFYPGLVNFKENLNIDKTLKEKLDEAAAAAEEGFENTKNLLAKHGRAAFHGEKSKEYKDPGAAVAMLIFKGIANSYR